MTETIATFASVFALVNLSERQRDALAAVKPELAAEFVRLIYREVKNNPHSTTLLIALLRRAEESGLPLSEWISDSIVVYQWLSRRGQTASLTDTVEYISCAFEGSALQMGHSLEWYLECHGFANAKDKAESSE